MVTTESVMWGVLSTHIWCHRALQPLFQQHANNSGIGSAFRECTAEEGWSRTHALGSPWGSGRNLGQELLIKLSLRSFVSQMGITRACISYLSHHDDTRTDNRQLEVLVSLLLFGLISVSLHQSESIAHHRE